MRTAEESFDLIERALRSAEGDEADAVFFAVDRNISRFANSNLLQNMSERSAELTIRVVSSGRMGVASTTSLDDDEIRRVAALARDIARRSEPIPGFKGLVSAGEPVAALRTFDHETAALAPEDKARSLRALFETGAGAGVHYAGSFTTAAASISTGNSHGIRRHAPVSFADAMVIATSDSGSGFASRIDRRYNNVDIVSLGEEATRKATLFSGALPAEIDPGEYDVVLEPPALTEIFEWMNMITFSGQSYEDGSSFFVDHLGKQVLGRNFTLHDDPVSEDFMPFPFDMEGTAKKRTAIVEAGVPRTPVVDKLMADRLGITPTGHAAAIGSEDHGTPLHLSMSGGEKTRDELISETERGIWVTRFHYLNGLLEPRTALMTGMTRDGTFLIENGRVTRRLVNLRWTQSMVEAFSNLAGLTRERRAVGSWWNPIGATITPTVLIRKWKITGAQRR